MKVLPYYLALFGALPACASDVEIKSPINLVEAEKFDVGIKIPRGIVSEEDVTEYKDWYIQTTPINPPRDIFLMDQLGKDSRDSVVGDHAAEEAMNLLLNCWHWLLVDHCEDHLQDMTEPHKQLFKEALILVAPHFDICEDYYTQKVVNLVGDPLSITPQYFQNKELLQKMFCYGAAYGSESGYGWCMTEVYTAVCEELLILAYFCSNDEYEQLKKINAQDVAYGGACTEDYIPTRATELWPNLPDDLPAEAFWSDKK
jgi:hypothetical protein